jgi:tetratricopeptide (TPR) repeat protein
MRAAADDLVREGLTHHQAGRLDDADRLYAQALALDPGHADALNLSGLLALQSGRASDAAARIASAVRRQPKNWGFRANLASALLDLQDFDGALEAFRMAARLNPDEPQLQIAAANCLALRGDFAGAESQLRKVVRRYPGAASGWFNLGNAVRDQGRLEEAAKIFTRAVQLAPDNPDAQTNLGSVLHQLQRFDEALEHYRAAIRLQPLAPQAHCNLASALIDVGRFEEGEGAAREALRIDPRCVPGHSILAAALSSQGRSAAALPAYRAAVELAPGDVRLATGLGSALFEAGETREGIELLERLRREVPDSAAVHQGLAWAYLATADFAKGWREYYHRPARGRLSAKQQRIELATDLPADLRGKRVCILREQGLGDELFFARFARTLIARGASVAYRADPRLVAMLQRTALFAEVVPGDAPLPAADYHVLLGDLPLALRSQSNGAEEETPATLPLTALAERVEEVRARLTALGPPPYIGVTWRGGIAPEQNRGANWAFFKQVRLEALAKALRDAGGTTLVLQRLPKPGEIELMAEGVGRPAHDLSTFNDDLEAMLALLTVLDDYVGVSNTNMHLRAGLGKTARVLVPAPAEWRWMTAGERSPWFPGFRIYRQGTDGSWSEVLERLRSDLA